MAVDTQLPDAALLVLRDRTNSDPQQVLVTAIDDLVAAGVWIARRERRGLRRRRVDVLSPADGEAPAQPEPLRYVDGVLRRVALALDRPFTLQEAARRLVLRGRRTPAESVRRTIEELVERGLLQRAPDLAAGAELLAASPAPVALRPTARDARARRDAIRALSPLGAAFVTAWAATPTGRGGFAFGAVGSGYDAGGHASDGVGSFAGMGGGDCGGGGDGGGGGGDGGSC